MPENHPESEMSQRTAPQWRVVAGLGSLSLFELGVSVYQFANDHVTAGSGGLVAAAILGGIGALEATGHLPHRDLPRIRGRF